MTTNDPPTPLPTEVGDVEVLALAIRQKRATWVGGSDGDFDHHLARAVIEAGWSSPADREAEAQKVRRVEALAEQWADSWLHGKERDEPWVDWLTPLIRDLRAALGDR